MTHLIQTIADHLPIWGHHAVMQYLDQSVQYNRDFAEQLDHPLHHKPEWHQWGILTHTRKFDDAFALGEAEQLFQDWGIAPQIQEYFSQSLDSITRKDLFRIGIWLHDLGKFAVRHLSVRQTHTYADIPDFSFGKHEIVSERLLHETEIHQELLQLGLTETQITYCGRVAALHYELAKIRDSVFRSNVGYNLAYITSEAHTLACKELMSTHPDYAVEMGVAYLCDTLAKTSLRVDHRAQKDDVLMQVTALGLDPRHMHAVMNQHIAIAASKSYLQAVFSLSDEAHHV